MEYVIEEIAMRRADDLAVFDPAVGLLVGIAPFRFPCWQNDQLHCIEAGEEYALDVDSDGTPMRFCQLCLSQQ